MDVTFLTLAEALEIHQDQIVRYGGEPGTRDMNLLRSALGMPAATYEGQYLHSDVFEMAAAYLFHIARNHPFVDGNKRVAAVAAIVFLDLNGYTLDAPPDALANMVLMIARGEKGKAEAALFLRANSGH